MPLTQRSDIPEKRRPLVHLLLTCDDTWKCNNVIILHGHSSDNDSGRQAQAESQRAGVHGGRRQDVAQGGKHPEAATGEKHFIEVLLFLFENFG